MSSRSFQYGPIKLSVTRNRNRKSETEIQLWDNEVGYYYGFVSFPASIFKKDYLESLLRGETEVRFLSDLHPLTRIETSDSGNTFSFVARRTNYPRPVGVVVFSRLQFEALLEDFGSIQEECNNLEAVDLSEESDAGRDDTPTCSIQ